MKMIINTIREWINEDVICKILLGVAIVMLVWIQINEFSRIGGNTNDSIMDKYIETLEVQADELMSEVIEFNELYYAGYFDEIGMLDGNG